MFWTNIAFSMAYPNFKNGPKNGLGPLGVKGGRPKELIAVDERAIISQINIGKAENAVEITKNLNNIISNPVSTQTIRNVLKKCNMKAVVKNKSHYYLLAIKNSAWILF
jgi:hypothetical protein